MIFLRKTPARILLLTGALAGVAWLASLDYAQKISTNVLDLIPAAERSPELAVVRSLAGEKQARVALFALRVPGDDDDTRDRAAAAFTASLLASGAFAEAEITTDTTSRNALAGQIFAQRLALLLPGWLAENESHDTAALAEKTAADLERFMSKPEALAFAELLPHDPLLLLPTLVEKVQSLDTTSTVTASPAAAATAAASASTATAAPGDTATPGDTAASTSASTAASASSTASTAAATDTAAPGDTALIWTLTRENPLAEAGQKPVFAAVAAALSAAQKIAPDATLRWTAISLFAAESKQSIMRELTLGTLLTLIAVLGLAVICLPRIAGTLNLAPVIFGALLGACAAVTLCFGRVHVLVFVLGLMLAGVSIDYGFYLYLQPRKIPGEPYAAKVRRLLKPLLGSALTTVLGFSLLLFSDLPLIRQLGVFVSAGLLCALVTAVLWFAQIKNPFMQARAFVSAQPRPGAASRRAAIAILALGALIALAGPWRLHWRDSTQELQPRLPRLAQDAADLRAFFGDTPARTIYLTRGETIADARASLEKFTAWHNEKFPAAATASLGYAIPLRADHDALPARLEKLRDFPDALRAALDRHGFNAGEFEPFFTVWKNFTPPANYDATIASLAASLRGQTALLMSTTPGASFLITAADHPASAAEPPAALATASLNQLESLNKLFARYRISALRLSAIGLALVGLGMWLIYGVKRGTLIFTTPVGSCLFAFGLLGICGVTLNLFHLLGAFLGVCLSHNYAIFTAENDARKEQPPPSIRLSALSTAASFGVLACSSIPVVSALGVTVALIVLSALATVELKRIARPPAPPDSPNIPPTFRRRVFDL
jgi:predicted exporter